MATESIMDPRKVVEEPSPGRPSRSPVLASRGARVQFDIAIALTSVIPLLVLAWLATGWLWGDGVDPASYLAAIAVSVLMVLLGNGMLVKYPLTVIRLRRYLENIVKGDLPVKISLDDSEDDITSIQECMNRILEELKRKVHDMEQEQARMESQLRQASKLNTIGMLAAGIAHEINTPVQFVSDNTRFLAEAGRDLLQLLDANRGVQDALEEADPGNESLARVREIQDGVDLAFLENEIPAAITQSLEGLGQVVEITRAMKDFSLMTGEDDKTETDLNQLIAKTVVVTRNEWKYVAEVGTDLDESLPLVPCYPSDLKEVLVNLIVNAAQAIGEAKAEGRTGKGRIRISTRSEPEKVVISVADDGAGIARAIRNRVFEPFFTTKTGGKGTGLGLAIVHSLIAKRHGGDVSFESEPGRGTTFTLRLPLVPSPEHATTGVQT